MKKALVFLIAILLLGTVFAAPSMTAKGTHSKKTSIVQAKFQLAAVHKIVKKNKPQGFQKGDMDENGKVNFDDIDMYVTVLGNQDFYRENNPLLFSLADFDDNGALNQGDIDSFVTALSR